MKNLSLSPEASKVISFYKTLSKLVFGFLYGFLPFLGALLIIFYMSFRQVDASGEGIKEMEQLIKGEGIDTYFKIKKESYDGFLGNLIGENLSVDKIGGIFVAGFLGKDLFKGDTYIGSNVLATYNGVVLPRRFYLKALSGIEFSGDGKLNFYLDVLELASINNIDAEQLGFPGDFLNPDAIKIKGSLASKFRLSCLDAPGVVMPFCKKSFDSFLNTLPKINLTVEQVVELKSLIKKGAEKFGDEVYSKFCQGLYNNLKFTADPFEAISPKLYYECENSHKLDQLREFIKLDKMFFENDILNLGRLNLPTQQVLKTWALLSFYQLLKDNGFSKDSLQSYVDLLYKNQNLRSSEDGRLIYFFNTRLIKPVLKKQGINDIYSKIDAYDLMLKKRFNINVVFSSNISDIGTNNLISAQTIINYIFDSYKGEFVITSKKKIKDLASKRASLWEVEGVLSISFEGKKDGTYTLPISLKIEIYSPWSYLIKDININGYEEITKILKTYVANNEVNSFSLILSRIKDYFKVYQKNQQTEDLFCVQARNLLQQYSQKINLINCGEGEMLVNMGSLNKTLKVNYRGYQIIAMDINDPEIQQKLDRSLQNKILIVSSLPVIIDSILDSSLEYPSENVEDILNLEKLFKIYFKTPPILDKKLGEKKYSVIFSIKKFRFKAYVDLTKKKIYRLFVETKDLGSKKTIYKIIILPKGRSLCFSYTCKETINLLVSSPEQFLKTFAPYVWKKYFQE